MTQKFNKIVELSILIFYTIITIGMLVMAGNNGFSLWLNVVCHVVVISFEIVMFYIVLKVEDKRFFKAMYMFISLTFICAYGFHAGNHMNLFCMMLFLIACILALYGEARANIIMFVFSLLYIFAVLVRHYPYITDVYIVSFCVMLIGQVAIIMLLNMNDKMETKIKYRLQSNSDLLRLVEIKRREAKQATKAKGDFLATMSHEIRTPMNAICGMAELLTQTKLTPLGVEYVNTIKLSSENLLGIINDILDFSKIESGMLEFIDAEYEVSNLITNVQNMINTKIGTKKLSFIINVNPKLPMKLIGDELRVEQILLNLLTNAVKFTERGKVELSVDYEMVSPDTLMLKIAVNDTGIGISQDDIEKLFNAFTQVDMERNRNIEGTGLGLAITSQLCKQMHGKVYVESEYGIGSTFCAEFEQKVADISSIDVDIQPYRNKIVYIFEENEFYRESLANLMDELKIPYHFQKDVNRLKSLLKNHKSEIVLYDYSRFQKEMFLLTDRFDRTIFVSMVVLGQVLSDAVPDNMFYLYKPINIFNLMPVLTGNVSSNHISRSEISSFYAPDARVMVIDDTLANLKVAEGLMNQYKMEIVLVESGIKALEILENDKNFDMLFVDHMMPIMDGVELVRQIRVKIDKFYKMVPIVALTANAIKGIDEMFLRNGFDDFLPKPISIKRLGEILHKWLPKNKQILKEDYNANNDVSVIDDNSIENAEKCFDVIPGFSIYDGLSLCDERLDVLLGVIKVYVKSAPDIVERLNNKFANQDEQSYGIEAHGLKSSSKSIGAIGFSNRAKTMESECKAGHWDYVMRNHEIFVAEYRELVKNLKDALDMLLERDTVSNMPIDFGEFYKQLKKVRDELEDWNTQDASEIMNYLLKFDMPKELRRQITDINDSIDLFDYSIAIQKIDEMISKEF